MTSFFSSSNLFPSPCSPSFQKSEMRYFSGWWTPKTHIRLAFLKSNVKYSVASFLIYMPSRTLLELQAAYADIYISVLKHVFSPSLASFSLMLNCKTDATTLFTSCWIRQAILCYVYSDTCKVVWSAGYSAVLREKKKKQGCPRV